MSNQQTNSSKIPLLYSLHNSENYVQSLTHSTGEILNKYRLLVIEYLLFINETINSCKTNDNCKFIILRGLTTISYVFIFILHSSRNLNMAYYHSQKAFYYYTEFIGQITGDQNVFLQLTSRDAMMFVYKKTIFEIHSDYKKSNVLLSDLTNENEKMDFLDAYVQIIKNLVVHSIHLVDFKNIKQNDVSYKTTIVDKIDHICEFINKYNIPLDLFLDIKYLVDYLTNNSITESYYEIIQKYIVKVIKKTETTAINENIKDNIHRYFQLKNKIDDVDTFISKII
jgi:serine/threonine protein kinase